MRCFFCSLLLACLLCPTGAFADLYQWTDSTGVLHIVDESVEVPTEFRNAMKVYHTNKSSSSGKTFLPSRSFAENTQGRFAQKLAQDLGLIERESEDALTALTSVGISPAGGWKAYDSLSREAADEVIASARRAAESHRLSLSADGAEGVVQQALGSFILAGPPKADVVEPAYREDKYYNSEPAVVEYKQEVIEVIPQPAYVYSPVVVVTSHHHPHRRLSKPRRFRRQPPEATGPVSSPFSSSRFTNKRSRRPFFSTPPLPLRRPSPFPFASPYPGVRR